MKLKFSVPYRTEWGQSLHVNLVCIGMDGRRTTLNLPMQTHDGELWQAETAVREQRQRPVVAVVYSYQVEDAGGKVLRREWSVVPRMYAFDGTMDYVFPDHWRDLPTHLHLYTSAYARSVGLPWSGCKIELPRVPLYRRTLLLRVSAPQLQPGQVPAVCGSHPALGNWNPSRYVKMLPIGCHDWLLPVNADMLSWPVDYKYVVVNEHDNTLLQWEEGENRTTGNVVMADGQVLAIYDEALRVPEKPWRVASVAVAEPTKKLIEWGVGVGFKLVECAPVPRGNARLRLSQVRKWQQTAAYAREKGVALMGHITLCLEQERAMSNVLARIGLLESCFDALVLHFSLPQEASRHADYWAYLAAERVEQVMANTHMLVLVDAGEAGALLEPALKRLHPVMVKHRANPCEGACEFGHTGEYPYRSAAVVSAAGGQLLSQWWGADVARAQRYYVTILHRKGKAPQMLTPDVAEDVVARHLFAPSMVCMVSASDLVAMHPTAKGQRPTAMWLAQNRELNEKLQLMMERSKR